MPVDFVKPVKASKFLERDTEINNHIKDVCFRIITDFFENNKKLLISMLNEAFNNKLKNYRIIQRDGNVLTLDFNINGIVRLVFGSTNQIKLDGLHMPYKITDIFEKEINHANTYHVAFTIARHITKELDKAGIESVENAEDILMQLANHETYANLKLFKLDNNRISYLVFSFIVNKSLELFAEQLKEYGYNLDLTKNLLQIIDTV